MMNCEVTKNNFDHQLTNLKLIISNADFIAVNGVLLSRPENSALSADSYVTAERHYQAVRNNVDKYQMIQFSITAFQFTPADNTYSACTHVFYIHRRNFPPTKCKVAFNVSALHALQFDFNKLLKSGIPYLNEPEEEMVYNDLLMYAVTMPHKRSENFYIGINQDFQKIVDKQCSYIDHWQHLTSEYLTLTLNDVDYGNKLQVYLLLKEINLRFGFLWASYNDTGKIVVKKVNQYERVKFETDQEKAKFFERDFLKSCIGFSRLFELLTNIRKPIVGNDLFVDLMTMYSQFHEPLPGTYEEYKEEMHSLLPCIYDVQFMSYELQKKFKEQSVWKSNELNQLYLHFKEDDDLRTTSYSPTIKLVEVFDNSIDPANMDMFVEEKDRNKSFQVGYCFIKMMHILASYNNSSSGIKAKPLMSHEHLLAVQDFKNSVHISRSNIGHMFLGGPVQKTDTYQWLLVTSAQKGIQLNTSILNMKCHTPCKSVVVRMISKEQALVGCGSSALLRKLHQVINKDEDFKAVVYNCTESTGNSVVPALLWSGAVACLFAGAWVIFKKPTFLYGDTMGKRQLLQHTSAYVNPRASFA